MIETKQLTKSFKDGDKETQVLKGINFKVETGEFVAIMGRSGAGKSTLLYQLSLLDEPSGGEILIDGVNTHLLTLQERISFRLNQFGYVFQDYALLPDLTAIENVALPLLMQNVSRREAYAIASAALTKAGLGDRLHNLPSQLSGGQQQRVSIARAVAHRPKVLFADEPTANLDRESSLTVLGIFKELHDSGQSIIMVTHEEEYATVASRIVRLDDGRIVSEQRN